MKRGFRSHGDSHAHVQPWIRLAMPLVGPRIIHRLVLTSVKLIIWWRCIESLIECPYG
jgi:hypothetical protein